MKEILVNFLHTLQRKNYRSQNECVGVLNPISYGGIGKKDGEYNFFFICILYIVPIGI